ncbi:MAG: hypothetical protein Q8908_13510 [Bacteroidota bacterium]|nr:hypothetical protein [Bacteroidota bacterium]
MAIKIKHQFFDRLNTVDDNLKIKYLIIGTFNPGPPEIDLLDPTEKRQFEVIEATKKYIDSQSIMNFYDRSKNRFWKIMDILNSESFYQNNFELINAKGLKFYKTKVKMNREKTFDRQQAFCKTHEIFITDLTKYINPSNFCNIYENFPDKVIEQSNPELNTIEIIAMIKKYHINTILINFDFKSKNTHLLNSQILKIKKEFPDKTIERILSPSGAAGNSYSDLLNDWKRYIKINNQATNNV